MRLQLLLAALCATCTYCTGIRLRDISNDDQTKNLGTDGGGRPSKDKDIAIDDHFLDGGDLLTPPPTKGEDWRHGDYEGLGLRNYLGDKVEEEKPVPRPGENGGGLPPSRPGENGGGLPPLPPSRPGENGGGLPPLPPSRPGENGGGLPPLPPSRPGENGGGLPPIYLRPGNAKCVAQRDPGPCRALIPRYHYDAMTNSCRRFNYGGCLGNSNNFVSADDCQRSCVVQEKPKEPSHRHGEKPCWKNKRRCQGPAVTGPCRAFIPRFYYDAGSNTCRPFIYGGCDRNDNHWIHQKNCESVCLRKSKPSKCRNGDGNIFYIPPRRRHCPVMTCSKHCKHGYKRDKHGCATCHCLKHCKHRHHARNNERHLIVNLDF